jgi:hypothetical protein
MIIALSTTATVVSGVAGGVVGGGIAGGLGGGNLNSTLSGLLAGGITDREFAGLGTLTSGWDPIARIGAYGVAGGTVSEVRGGSFVTGFEASTLQALLKLGIAQCAH